MRHRPAFRLVLVCAAAFATASFVALALQAGPSDALPPGHPPVEAPGEGLTPERRRRLEEHAARFKEAVAKDPKDAESWRGLGFVHQALGQAAEARSDFERLTALRPDDEGAHFILALIHEKLGDTARAIASWEAFLRVAKSGKHRAVAQKHLKHLRGEK